jgi:ATP-binding cassette subfamily B protein
MITHDLSLAPDADRVLVVDDGRLVEAGTHAELAARGGTYARLAGAGGGGVDGGDAGPPTLTAAPGRPCPLGVSRAR